MVSKKGVSDVVSTVLIILLVVASIAIIGAIVLRLTNNAGTKVQTTLACQELQIAPTRCTYTDTTQNSPVIIVNRGKGGSTLNVTEMKAVFYRGAISENKLLTPIPAALNSLSYDFSSSPLLPLYTPPTEVAVFASIKSSSGTVVPCPLSKKIDCSSQSTAGPGPGTGPGPGSSGPPYLLTLKKAGNGRGTVTSGTSFNCTANCTMQSVSYSSTASVSLTAVADSASTFTSWTGCTTTSGNVCNVVVNNTINVTSTFTPIGGSGSGPGPGSGSNDRVLSLQKTGTGIITSSPSGISCGTACSSQSVSFNSGTTVILTATGPAGWNLGSWSGCDSESGNTCTVSMTAAKSVTANFVYGPHSLTFVKTGNGIATSNGAAISNVIEGYIPINCPESCTSQSADLNNGTLAILTALNTSGWTFTSWSGCNSVSGNVCNVIVDASKTVTANFADILPPSLLTSTAKNYEQVNLSWRDNSNNEQGFRIERTYPSSNTWILFANTSRNVNSLLVTIPYSDTVQANYNALGINNPPYKFRVYAYNNSLSNSTYSNVRDVSRPCGSSSSFPGVANACLIGEDSMIDCDGDQIDETESSCGQDCSFGLCFG